MPRVLFHLLAAIAALRPLPPTDAEDQRQTRPIWLHAAGDVCPKAAFWVGRVARKPARLAATGRRAIATEAPDCVLLHISSSEVYGGSFRAGVALDETAVAAPMNVYASTKAAADLALGAVVGEGLCFIRLRPFNDTDPGQSADFVVPGFGRHVARIEAGLQPPVMRTGALDPQRDFLDGRDVCAAYVARLRRADAFAFGTILNIASGVPRRIGDVLDQLLGLSGRRRSSPSRHCCAAATSGWRSAVQGQRRPRWTGSRGLRGPRLCVMSSTTGALGCATRRSLFTERLLRGSPVE